MKLDLSPETISEANYAKLFAEIVEALHQSGQIATDETAACITYPAGTTHVAVPLKGKA
jgi:hypothetical protein